VEVGVGLSSFCWEQIGSGRVGGEGSGEGGRAFYGWRLGDVGVWGIGVLEI